MGVIFAGDTMLVSFLYLRAMNVGMCRHKRPSLAQSKPQCILLYGLIVKSSSYGDWSPRLNECLGCHSLASREYEREKEKLVLKNPTIIEEERLLSSFMSLLAP